MAIDSIGIAVATAKNAIDIAKAIGRADSTLEKAELKLKVAELVEALADLRHQITAIQDDRDLQKREIDRLTEALKLKAKLVRKHDAYYETGPDGEPSGDPFCQMCWERNADLFHLRWDGTGGFYICGHCGGMFDEPRPY